MQIHRIEPGDRRGAARFNRVPFDLYRGHPHWVPPLRGDIRWAMDRRRHPFYRRGEADFFLAVEGENALGRLAVIENRASNQYWGRTDAFFSFFDADDDPAVTAALFDTAADWATARGLTRLMGPRGLLPMEGNGVLIEGFESLPALSIPYNHPYYGALLENAGFSKETDVVSGRLSIDHHEVPPHFLEMADAVAESGGYEIKTFRSRRELRRWIPRIAAVYNRSFTDNWEFWPVSDEEAHSVLNQVAAIADPHQVMMLLCRGDLVGFMFITPSISGALQRIGGRLWPFGWVSLLRARTRATSVDFLGMGLVPEHRGTGANAVIYAEIARGAPATRFTSAELLQVDEANAPILSNMAPVGVDWHKHHRVYRRDL